MSDPDEVRLLHMLDAAELAVSFTVGRVREDLDRNPMLLHASVNCLLIIGEAASQVSIARRNGISGIPWPQIVGMRNRLIHAYFQIDRDIVWDTLVNNLPPLVSSLRKELRFSDDEEE